MTKWRSIAPQPLLSEAWTGKRSPSDSGVLAGRDESESRGIQTRAGCPASDQLDRDDDTLIRAKNTRKQTEELFPGAIFPIEQPHTAIEIITGDDFGAPVDPLARHGPAHVAWSNLDDVGPSQALGLAG